MRRLRSMLIAFRDAGGERAVVLLHDEAHGTPLIDALARFGDGLPANCLNLAGRGYPEDATNFNVPANGDQAAQNAQVPSDVVLFAEFMRLLAPPVPSQNSPGGAQSINAGFALFKSIGCAVCHTPAIRATQPSNVTASLGNATFRRPRTTTRIGTGISSRMPRSSVRIVGVPQPRRTIGPTTKPPLPRDTTSVEPLHAPPPLGGPRMSEGKVF